MLKDIIKLYDKLIATAMTKDRSTKGVVRDNFYSDFKGFYSGGKNVTYVYSIDHMPNEVELSFRSRLRRECKPGVRMSFITNLERFVIQWNSPQMKAKLMAWKTIESNTEGVDDYNLHDNLMLLDSQRWLRDSLRYLSTAEIRRKRKTFRVRSILLVSGVRGSNFDSTIKELTNLCRSMNIRLTRVLYEVPKFLGTFSPFSNYFNADVVNGVGSNVITDELIARFNTYSQGTLGLFGIYFGTDIYSKFPVLKPVKLTEDKAENWLITAKTGGGKSYLVKYLILELLSRDYNGTIMDIEGFEYIPLGLFMSKNSRVEIINMAEGSGKYFDPVEIVMTGIPDLDKETYSMSINLTVSIFKVLLGDAFYKDVWLDTVINDAVSKTYFNAGVTEDPTTWSKSEGLSLFVVYKTLCGLREFRSNVEYKNAVDKAIALTGRYFEQDGTRAKLFKNRVSVKSVLDAKLVICSFGMAGKSPQAVDPIQMALMQLNAAHVSHLRTIFSKARGKYNFKLWEEFQRWGGFPDSDKTIGVALTGGRKMGDVNIILTNEVHKILADDKFGIFSNITSIAIGNIPDATVRQDLVNRLSIPQMLPELDTIARENKDLESYNEGEAMDSPYKYAFLVGLDDTKYSIVRMRLPDELRKSQLFKTGVDKK